MDSKLKKCLEEAGKKVLIPVLVVLFFIGALICIIFAGLCIERYVEVFILPGFYIRALIFPFAIAGLIGVGVQTDWTTFKRC